MKSNLIDNPPKAHKRSSQGGQSGEAKSRSPTQIRAQAVESIRKTLNLRCNSDQSALSGEIEESLFDSFKDTNQKYLTKLRSILFNLKDKSNNNLLTNVVSGVYSPAEFVGMTTAQMASRELSEWRSQNVDNNMAEIKRMNQLSLPLCKMTHKGEVPLGEEDLKVFSTRDDDILAKSSSSLSEEETTPSIIPLGDSLGSDLRELERLRRETETLLNSSELRPLEEFVWEGCLLMEEMLYCPVVMTQLPGCNFEVGEMFPPSLEICGRIQCQNAFDYIRTSLNSRRKGLVVLQLMARNEEDRHKLTDFAQYLTGRDRLAVVGPHTDLDLYVAPYPSVDVCQLIRVVVGDSAFQFDAPFVFLALMRTTSPDPPQKVQRVLFNGTLSNPRFSP